MPKKSFKDKFNSWLPNLVVGLLVCLPTLYSLGSYFEKNSQWKIYNPDRYLLEEDFARFVLPSPRWEYNKEGIKTLSLV